MKKVWKENKWLIIFWFLVIIMVFLLLRFLRPSEMINNIIQAILIVTLVFVTFFYAKQTQRLVEEERKSLEEIKKKRDADYWERRISEFYKPFIDKLNNMIVEIRKDPIDTDRTWEIIKNTGDFF